MCNLINYLHSSSAPLRLDLQLQQGTVGKWANMLEKIRIQEH
jgi:hypothetical protein